ncbi:MAG TPA: alpha-L-fucosidase [Candidatus Merdivicinus intestinavium]|nr:alpha-L-fucosidase [Candidatus Merdivicinus intestinavium]
MSECPKYLKEYEEIWKTDPKKAKLAWFRDARYGLFLHYGLYSLLHRQEWVQFYEKIPVSEYEKLADQFTAHNFDADYITDLALKAGMKYINLTTCHHEGFCLWDSKAEPFNSKNAAAGRDLVKELSEACDRKGLGFFAYYTFMLNWRHPYFVDRSVYENARPDYETPEPRYLYRKKEDFRHYLDYIEQVMDELLSNYKITGIWLDLIGAWYAMGEEYIPIEDIYARLRARHPDVLISWKQGATGTEDFASPENSFHDMAESIRPRFGDAGAERARRGFEGNRNKHNEVCSTVQRGCWGYNPLCENRSVEELYQLLGHAAEHNCNLLLNVGPMADGSIHPNHAKILLELGEKIRREGFPESGNSSRNQTGAGAE